MLDGVLIAEPVAALDGVVGVPTPVVFGHVGESGVDPSLRRHGVRPGREDLSDARRVQSMRDEACGGPETGTPSPDHHSIETGSGWKSQLIVQEKLLSVVFCWL